MDERTKAQETATTTTTAQEPERAAAVAETAPPTDELHDHDLDRVAGGDWLMMPAGHARSQD